MKKVLLTTLLSLLVATCLGTSVYAAESPTFSGSMYIQTFFDKNPTYDDDADADQQYWKQRLRVSTSFPAAEGITVHSRFDLSEGVWGDGDWKLKRDGWTRGNPDEDESIHVDRAYLQLDKEGFNFKAGQFYQGAGKTIIWDHQNTGLTFTLKQPVSITFAYFKLDENETVATEPLLHPDTGDSVIDPTTGEPAEIEVGEDGLTDEEGVGGMDTRDVDLYGLNFTHAMDNMAISAFLCMVNDSTDNDDSPWGIGVHANFNLGMITLDAELDYLGGKMGKNTDYIGTQGVVDVAAKVSDTFTAGGSVLFAIGTDEADEIQRTAVTAGGESFDPITFRGKLSGDLHPSGTLYGGMGRSMFDPAGSNGGVIGGALYGEMQIGEPLFVGATLGYLTPQEDSNTNFESLMSLCVSADYKIMDSTKFSAGAAYVSEDWDNNMNEDPRIFVVTKLQVSF